MQVAAPRSQQEIQRDGVHKELRGWCSFFSRVLHEPRPEKSHYRHLVCLIHIWRYPVPTWKFAGVNQDMYDSHMLTAKGPRIR
jgi:hypothetical protein